LKKEKRSDFHTRCPVTVAAARASTMTFQNAGVKP
jgi:hypothetical protein